VLGLGDRVGDGLSEKKGAPRSLKNTQTHGHATW